MKEVVKYLLTKKLTPEQARWFYTKCPLLVIAQVNMHTHSKKRTPLTETEFEELKKKLTSA